ncbi:MAG TPA: beta-ketoacyl-ACP synthase II [Candidatus Dormibacteraeota bacterium]|nr:beta-ketoacyl-ACP synthase II [Candidatus Dormibacteraeota bacterium]
MIAPTIRHRVALTGIGMVTPIGTGRRDFWEGVRSGRRGVGPLTRFDASALRTRIAGEIPSFDFSAFFSPRRAGRMDRFAQLSIAAAQLAIEDAGLRIGEGTMAVPETEVGVTIGSALGGVPSAEADHVIFLESGLKSVPPSLATRVFAGAGACNVAIAFNARGPVLGNSNSCASGAIAIGEAFRAIRDGDARAMITGGVEAPLAPLTFAAFTIIKAMSTTNDEPARASRPFDARRDGFVMAEGAAILVLEEMKSALTRDARIYAEVAGFATTNDAFHMTAPQPQGRDAARAMRLALRDAGLTTDEIEAVNAHGSSTVLNDRIETLAIKEVLGERARRVPVSGTKGLHAHALGASGAMEAAIASLSVSEGYLPSTANLDHPDPECDLDYVPKVGRAVTVRTIISNSFGFGGTNACLVFKAVDT